jgi:hypothetical protein
MTDPSAFIEHAGYRAAVVLIGIAVFVGLAVWVVDFIVQTRKDRP